MVLMMSEAATMGEFGFVATLPKTEERPKSAWDELEEIKIVWKSKGTLIPVNFAVKLLEVSRQRVYDLVETGRLETVQFGHNQFITESSLKAFATSERKTGRPLKVPTLKDAVRAARDYAKESVRKS